MKLSSTKRVFGFVFLFSSFLVAQGVTDTNGPSLGQVARENRDAKSGKSRKVYTNEDLPQSGGISVVGVHADEPATTANDGLRIGHRRTATGAGYSPRRRQ